MLADREILINSCATSHDTHLSKLLTVSGATPPLLPLLLFFFFFIYNLTLIFFFFLHPPRTQGGRRIKKSWKSRNNGNDTKN